MLFTGLPHLKKTSINKGLQTTLTFRTIGKLILYPLINAHWFEVIDEVDRPGDDAVNLALHCLWLPQQTNSVFASLVGYPYFLHHLSKFVSKFSIYLKNYRHYAEITCD